MFAPGVDYVAFALCAGLFLRWTEHAETMDEVREEIWTVVKEHRGRTGTEEATHTLLHHHDAITAVENLMDELTIL